MTVNSVVNLKKFVPLDDIKRLILQYDDSTSVLRSTKDDLINRLQELEKLNPALEDDLAELISKHISGGRGARTWGIPIEPISFTKDSVTEFILQKNESNPFINELKPKLNRNPSLNKAIWVSDNLLKLEFVASGNSYQVEDNYILRTINPTKRIYVFLRLFQDTFFIECRLDVHHI